MIRHLYMKNFILIEELSLDFEEGFSAFTGETGAGKSILIDAISLLRADRASASFVMKGCEKAIVEGTFDLKNDKWACSVLEDAGFDVNDETVFTREIYASGKSAARIDHRSVNLSLMKEVLKNQLDIHGQRDTAYLLNTKNHMHLLDAYIQDDALLQETKKAFDAYDALVKEKEQALQDTYNENDLEYFRYQIQEIEESHLEIGEDEKLENKEKKYKAVKESYDKLSSIFSLYDDSLSSDLYELNKLVSSLKSGEEISRIADTVNDAYYSLSDAMDSLRAKLDDMNLSEDEINEMEERLYLIQKLKRKYGHTIEDILAKKDELEKQVEMITHKQAYLDQMDQKIAKAKAVYDKAAAKLTKERKKYSTSLDQEIARHLHKLMLDHARFQTMITLITEGKPSPSGSDHVEFYVAMNQGQDLKPLVKTASGGELSRLMLGLKVIFTKLQGIQTVIFDEIDTGVSGPVATAIGEEMKQLGNECQVFSVTHLAQVAACAGRQYLVAKETDGKTTRTNVKLLSEEERIRQLALIASGEVTPASLSAAEELYKRNQAS